MSGVNNSCVTVSVVMPTYNRSDVLAEAIDSVLAQDYEHWELLVVDDGSTDETSAVLDRYRDYDNITLIRQDNAGQSVARNVAIEKSTGDWVAFLDSDNRWLPKKLSLQIQAIAKNPEADVIYGDIETFGIAAGDSSDEREAVRPSGDIFDELLINNIVNFNTSLVRASRLREVGGFDASLRCGEDYDLWLRLAAHSQFHFLPGVVTQYRIEGDRVSDNVKGVFLANKYSVTKAIVANADRLERSQSRMALARIYSRYSRGLAEKGEFGGAVSAAARAVLLAPIEPRIWRTFVAAVLKPFRQ